MIVFRPKATRGHGWARSIHDGRPIVTADRDEAFEWSTREAAAVAAAELDGGWIVFEGEGTPGGPTMHGARGETLY